MATKLNIIKDLFRCSVVLLRLCAIRAANTHIKCIYLFAFNSHFILIFRSALLLYFAVYRPITTFYSLCD